MWQETSITNLLDKTHSLSGENYSRNLSGPGCVVWEWYGKDTDGNAIAIMLDANVSVSEGQIGIGLYRAESGTQLVDGNDQLMHVVMTSEPAFEFLMETLHVWESWLTQVSFAFAA
jgi:hypothetical protein